MNITLEIVDDIDEIFAEYVYWGGDSFDIDYGSSSGIDDLKTLYNDLYAKRPDGTWYNLVDFWKFSANLDQQIYDLIQSGLEPYQAFEVVAL